MTFSNHRVLNIQKHQFVFPLVLFGVIWALTGSCKGPDRSDESNVRDIVFLITDDPDNYEADKTIPVFARQLEDNFQFTTHVLMGEGPREAYRFPDLSILREADLLVIFCRRLALPEAQMKQIKHYIEQGKPVMGIRTANHAFSVRGDTIPPGYTDWWDFVPDVLGSSNEGYGPVEPGTNISVVSSQASHPILQGIEESYWHSIGNVYKVGNSLDDDAKVLLRGTVESEDLDEPVAWLWENQYGGQVFYSSVGHPADFENSDNVKILNQAIAWLTQNTY